MIDKNIKLTKGMEIYQEVTPLKNRHFMILKVARKYATVISSKALPDIDRPEKVLIAKIYTDFFLQRLFHTPPKVPRKTILIRSPRGNLYEEEIDYDRDPNKFLKHNAQPGATYIKTLDKLKRP